MKQFIIASAIMNNCHKLRNTHCTHILLANKNGKEMVLTSGLLLVDFGDSVQLFSLNLEVGARLRQNMLDARVLIGPTALTYQSKSNKSKSTPTLALY